MENIVELRESLCEVFDGLGNGSVDVKVACEQNNAAGKILNTIKMELANALMRKEKPEIDFMLGLNANQKALVTNIKD